MPDWLAHQVGKVFRAQILKDAERYRSRRLQVQTEILNQLASEDVSGEFIVIAHSLGSVVVADLLPYLRPGQHVRLLITVGSPLGIEGFWMWTANQLRREFPYDAVSAWVNIWSVGDPVCAF
jgi:alpha-beta hydrolase superfamily lysophospholipase